MSNYSRVKIWRDLLKIAVKNLLGSNQKLSKVIKWMFNNGIILMIKPGITK
jgi:hypothetical protein